MSDRIVAASWAGTAVFATAAAVAVVVEGARPVAAAVSLMLFAAGTVIFVWALLRGIGRSRYDDIAVASLFFLTGAAPQDVRRHLMASWAVQVAAGLAAAIARPYTSLAFGVLVPMYGLGLAGLWGARHGRYPRRQPSSGHRP